MYEQSHDICLLNKGSDVIVVDWREESVHAKCTTANVKEEGKIVGAFREEEAVEETYFWRNNDVFWLDASIRI